MNCLSQMGRLEITQYNEPKFASLGKRFLAYIFDHILFFGILFELAVRERWIVESQGAWTIKFSLGLVFLFQFIYYPVSWWLFGQSLGQRLFKIRIVNLDFKRITFSQAAVRLFGSYLGGPFFSAGFGLNENKQSWPDVIANTLAIDN